MNWVNNYDKIQMMKEGKETLQTGKEHDMKTVYKAGHELLDLIQKYAYHDMYVAILTPDEYNSIINLCYKAHIKMMEDNYNAGWQDNQ